VSDLLRSVTDRPVPGLGRPLAQSERDQIDKYLEILVKWQKTHRLVGSIEPAWLVANVVLDSLCFLEALPIETRVAADLGSGAGIPGIPIAIVRPDVEISLIEAQQRRISFLSTVVRELALARVRVIGARAEDLGPEREGRFDALVMRCAGQPETMLRTALRLVRSGGVVIVGAGPRSKPLGNGERLVVSMVTGASRALHRYRKP
jgi:16S rRNA (guanine527-N7)-methyltransferase